MPQTLKKLENRKDNIHPSRGANPCAGQSESPSCVFHAVAEHHQPTAEQRCGSHQVFPHICKSSLYEGLRIQKLDLCPRGSAHFWGCPLQKNGQPQMKWLLIKTASELSFSTLCWCCRLANVGDNAWGRCPCRAFASKGLPKSPSSEKNPWGGHGLPKSLPTQSHVWYTQLGAASVAARKTSLWPAANCCVGTWICTDPSRLGCSRL